MYLNKIIYVRKDEKTRTDTQLSMYGKKTLVALIHLDKMKYGLE